MMEKKGKTISGSMAAATKAAGSSRARVARWLEEAISSGAIPRGSAIPSERELARKLGVAKNTVSAAIDEAVARGLVTCRPGRKKRYASDSKSSGTDYGIVVLALLKDFTDWKTAPRWTDAFRSLDVVRRLSFSGRRVSLVNLASLAPGGVGAALSPPPSCAVSMHAMTRDPRAVRALDICRESGIPAVVYGNAPELRLFDRVYSDHRAGSRDLTRWLLARGRKRIVPFFPFAPTRHWEDERLAGYAEAMREAGIAESPCATFGSPVVGDAQNAETFRVDVALAAAALAKMRRDGGGKWPDALLCLNDDWAKPAIAAIRSLGLAPGSDIVVAGYDNMTQASGFAPFEDGIPSVTIDKHDEKAAETIASLVATRLDGSLPPEPQTRAIPHELVVHGPEFTTIHPQTENRV